MNEVQREILQSLLKMTKKTPPEHRMEEIEMGLKAHRNLYHQEGDREGEAIYQEALDILATVKTPEELEARVQD